MAFDENYGLPVNLDDRGGTAWIMNPETGMAELNAPAARQQQPESCGRCHARRSVLASNYEYGKALTDTHMPSLLEENLYYADGRILDEVYVYGSFVQSKMYAAGVTCSDCHNPHSGDLLTGPDPDAVCSQCHLPTKFATSNHSGAASTACVDCHMPATTYMGVDDRSDHSFRIPDAGQNDTHYGTAIARASMLTLLAPTAGDAEFRAIDSGIEDPDPLVRIAALRTLRHFPPETRMRAGSRLLRDPVRGVRVEAALTYIDLRDLLTLEDARAFAQAADEYREAQLTAANMPESLTILGEFESQMGNRSATNRYFEHAVKLDPQLAVTRHTYGLFLVRAGRADEALEQLRNAADLEPTTSRYVYVLGVALNSLGQQDEALAVLSEAQVEFPGDFDIAWALATMLRDAGDIEAALSKAREMKQRFPDSPNVQALMTTLSSD